MMSLMAKRSSSVLRLSKEKHEGAPLAPTDRKLPGSFIDLHRD